MLIIILLTTKTFTLKTCFCQIPLIKRAEFAMLFLRVLEVNKNICFCFIMENISKLAETTVRELAGFKVLNRGPITHYSINFSQHKNFYDFFNSGIVDAFLYSVYEICRPFKQNKIQGYAEIVNQQRGEIILEDKRVWLTNSFNSKHFNDFVRGEIRDEITKRIIVNDRLVVVGTSKDLSN